MATVAGPGATPLGRTAWWVLCAVVVVPPLIVSPSAGDAFRLPKLMAAECLGLASVVALTWSGRLHDGSAWRRQKSALLAVLPLLAVATASLLWTGHPAATRRGLADFWIGVACLIAWTVGLHRAELRRLLRLLVWPAAALALLAVLQWHDVYRPLGVVPGYDRARSEVVSLAGNPGNLGGFLALAALILQSELIATWRSGRRRWVLAAALSLVAYGIVVSLTLTAFVALAAASAVFWALALPPRRALLAIAAAGALATVAVVATPALRARVVEKRALWASGNRNAVLSNRFDGWRAGAWMFARAPLTGVGFATYSAHFAPAKLALLERGEGFGIATSHHFANAHNDFVEVAAELGIAGLLALGVGLVVVARRAAALDREGAARAVGWGALVGLVLLAAGHFPFEVALTAYPAALLLAWVLRRQPEGAV